MYSSSSLLLLISGNADGNCLPQEELSLLQDPAFYSVVLLAIMIGLCCILGLTSYGIDTMKKSNYRMSISRRFSLGFSRRFSLGRARRQSDVDEKYAMKHLGEGSVYSFFLSESVVGWLIGLVTVTLQVCIVSNTLLSLSLHSCSPSIFLHHGLF